VSSGTRAPPLFQAELNLSKKEGFNHPSSQISNHVLQGAYRINHQMEERMNFGVLASCLHGRACLRDEVNRRRKSHGVNHRGAREGTPSDIFFAPSRRCLIRTRPSSLKTRTRKVSHSVITRKPHQLISIPAICLFSDTMKTSER